MIPLGPLFLSFSVGYLIMCNVCNVQKPIVMYTATSRLTHLILVHRVGPDLAEHGSFKVRSILMVFKKMPPNHTNIHNTIQYALHLHCNQERHHIGLPNSSPPLPTQLPPSCCPLRRSFVPRPCGASCLAARAAGDAKTSPQIWSSLACSAKKIGHHSLMEKNMISNRAYFFNIL